MHPYFQKSGSHNNFWTRVRETPRKWRTDYGLDPCAFIIAFSNLTAQPASLTTKHFSALNKLSNKWCQVCQGTQGEKTHVSTSANLRAVIRKGLQRCSSNQSVEQCRPEPRRTVPSPGHFHGLQRPSGSAAYTPVCPSSISVILHPPPGTGQS